MPSQCESGGGILGNAIDGTQAEFVRIPCADSSLYLLPAAADDDAMVRLNDILPTGCEGGVLDGCVKPGDVVAVVGAGPVGRSALLTAKFISPFRIIAIALDDRRLAVAMSFGATDAVNSADGTAVAKVLALTGGLAWMWPSRRSAWQAPSASASGSSLSEGISPAAGCMGRA
jgi:alcohol dehydrogenase